MKKNCYINRKSNGLMVGLVLLSSILSFTAQSAAFDQARYDKIVELYSAKSLSKDTADALYDINVVGQHKSMLDAKLAKANGSYVHRMFFNAAGKVFAAAALAGGVASAAGALGASSILGQSQNKGLTYLELLKARYGGTEFGPYKWRSSVNFLQTLSDNEINLVSFGSYYAPFAGMGSLVSAGISKYLLDKAASYTSEIARLEVEIQRDNEIIMALKAIQK